MLDVDHNRQIFGSYFEPFKFFGPVSESLLMPLTGTDFKIKYLEGKNFLGIPFSLVQK